MSTKVKVTNEELYNSKVDCVDASELSSTNYFNGISKNFRANGTIVITPMEGDNDIVSTGEHGSRDFKDDFGFILETAD